MTPSEWKSLQLGDSLLYSAQNYYRDYENTHCEIVGFNSNKHPIIAIVTPGIHGFTTWGSGKSSSDSFRVTDAYKFQLISSKRPTLEQRIANKIKALDTKWALKQKEKGNKYAMLFL